MPPFESVGAAENVWLARSEVNVVGSFVGKVEQSHIEVVVTACAAGFHCQQVFALQQSLTLCSIEVNHAIVGLVGFVDDSAVESNTGVSHVGYSQRQISFVS